MFVKFRVMFYLCLTDVLPNFANLLLFWYFGLRSLFVIKLDIPFWKFWDRAVHSQLPDSKQLYGIEPIRRHVLHLKTKSHCQKTVIPFFPIRWYAVFDIVQLSPHYDSFRVKWIADVWEFSSEVSKFKHEVIPFFDTVENGKVNSNLARGSCEDARLHFHTTWSELRSEVHAIESLECMENRFVDETLQQLGIYSFKQPKTNPSQMLRWKAGGVKTRGFALLRTKVTRSCTSSFFSTSLVMQCGA